MSRSLALFTLVAVGCAELPPVQTTLNVATMKLKESQLPITPDVHVAVQVITPENIDQTFKDLMVTVAWREKNYSQAHEMGSKSQAATNRQTGSIPILPLPLFVAKIANDSATPLSFSEAKFSLTDDKGKTFDIYGGVEEIQGRVESDMFGRYPLTREEGRMIDQLRENIGKLPILDKRTKIPAKSDLQGFIVFKMEPRDMPELDRYLQSVGALTLKVSNVKGAQPFDITVPVEKDTVPVAVTCPGGQPQTLEKCKRR